MLARLATVAVSVTLALLLSELAIRLFSPQVLYPRYVTGSEFGIRVNVPSARYWHTSPEVSVEFRTNSTGIRADREIAVDKPPGVTRIVALGDSFTFGYEVDLPETYLYLIEQELAEKGHRVEVINLGVSGYGTAEELIMLKEVGLAYAPDVVVLGYYQNDQDDNVRSGLYRLDQDGRVERDAREYLPAVELRDKLYSFWVYRWLAGNSQLFAFLREWLATRVKRSMVEEATSSSAERAPDDYPAILTAKLIDAIKRECDERDVAFVLLDIPDYTLKESNLPDHLLETVPEGSVVRMGPALRAAGARTDLYRQQGHFHWSPPGHRVAADQLGALLDRIISER